MSQDLIERLRHRAKFDTAEAGHCAAFTRSTGMNASTIGRQNNKPIWMVERHDQDDGSITYEIWDHNPETYRRITSVNDSLDEEGENARKDAETIARAVNSHDDMLAALRSAEIKLSRYMEIHGPKGQDPLAGTYSGGLSVEYEASLNTIRAAISKATS
jgi:hypothetical protein